jgi:5-formyltetrahydrofolate cyclo-ligase
MIDVSNLTKDEIRALASQRRMALDAEERRRLDERIAGRVRALPEVASARSVHIYVALRSRGEIETSELISFLRKSGKRIILPAVRNLQSPDEGLTHHEWDGSEPLRTNRWGIDEPHAGRAVPVSDIDVIVVPLLAADVEGNRIGYGKGYYDAFLRQTHAPAVGVVYEACLFDRVPAEEHDVPLDVIVTEKRVVTRLVTRSRA